jgi:hypothetical protein
MGSVDAAGEAVHRVVCMEPRDEGALMQASSIWLGCNKVMLKFEEPERLKNLSCIFFHKTYNFYCINL